jgi:outer membrane protein assembly factor BamB
VWTNTTQIGPVSQGIYGSASADDTHLFVAVDPYNVDEYEMLAISLADGTLDYGSHFVDWVNGTPAVGIGYVYSGDNAGWVYCVNKADGAVIWSNHIGGDINSGINLNGGVVYAKAGGNGLYALNGDNGAVIWSNLNADASTWSGNGPSMNADGSKIYYKTETGDIVGVNTADGSTIFTDTSGANGWGGQDPIVDDSGNVYCQLRGLEAAPDDDVVVSLSPTGAVNWTYTFTGHPMNHGGLALCEAQMTLYVSSDLGITALNTADGTEKWTTTGVQELKGGIAVGAGNMIMGVARQGGTAPEATVIGVKDNGTSGDLVWQVPLDAGQDSWSGPVILENGDVVVCTDGGEIARITVPEPGVLGALVLGLLLLIRRK